MHGLMDIIWKVTVAVIYTEGSTPSVRFSKVRLKKNKGRMCIVRKEEELDMAAAMSRPAAIIITGDNVSSKVVTDGDPSVARIMKGDGLYITVHTGSGVGPTVDFIRKDSLSGIIAELERDCALVTGIMVTRSGEAIDGMIENAFGQRLSISGLLSDLPLLSSLCGQLYRGLRIPLLVTYLVILAANWMVFRDMSVRLQQKRIVHEAELRNREAAALSDSRQRELERMFSNLPELDACVVAESVAGTVPSATRLTGMRISSGGDEEQGHSQPSGTYVSISGETLESGDIVEMSHMLAVTAGFRQSDISSIETDGRDRKMLKFRIEARR